MITNIYLILYFGKFDFDKSMLQASKKNKSEIFDISFKKYFLLSIRF